jgi:uncharacterized protein (DUF2126 family)
MKKTARLPRPRSRSLPASPSALAERVEKALTAAGHQLTMGGEPTFIPMQPEGDEWHNSAMGEQKIDYARRMAALMLADDCPGGVVMQLFGKHYPGEPLPRWVILILRRRDGTPLWPDPARLRQDDQPGKATPAQAQRLAKAIAAALQLKAPPLPAAESHKRETRGWVIPLDHDGDRWIGDHWPFDGRRPVKMIPGDSPIGLRLPLGSLPEGSLRRALTVECRQGHLEIFIPPLQEAPFAALLHILADLTKRLRLKDILFCGYAPDDPEKKLVATGLAADPGVLEVNLAATTDWESYAREMSMVYRQAERVGLCARKLHFNGQEQGTGGGSHLTFGGLTEASNPFAGSPQFLVNVLRYWQQHPALSYAFTGQYVGPYSQAPRVDESHPVGLRELDLACRGAEDAPSEKRHEYLDRLLRNLLTDSSGNTHRAEICLDKFANPYSPNGRLGIVEFRAFESYPDAAIACNQALLIRTILARLLLHPLKSGLADHGPALHDRYFLPWFIEKDLDAVLADLKTHGFAFDKAWVAPILAWRFPVLGRLPLGSGFLEVRQALESWPMLAEESRGASTVRMVDNSTDRLELRLTDASVLSQGELRVNDVLIAFQRIHGGQAIAGLRYKAVAGWPALQPHVPCQSPLRLAWVEQEREQSAALYHFWNPGGQPYPNRPEDEAEAHRRRLARWIKDQPGRTLRHREDFRPHPKGICTTDLRWYG